MSKQVEKVVWGLPTSDDSRHAAEEEMRLARLAEAEALLTDSDDDATPLTPGAICVIPVYLNGVTNQSPPPPPPVRPLNSVTNQSPPPPPPVHPLNSVTNVMPPAPKTVNPITGTKRAVRINPTPFHPPSTSTLAARVIAGPAQVPRPTYRWETAAVVGRADIRLWTGTFVPLIKKELRPYMSDVAAVTRSCNEILDATELKMLNGSYIDDLTRFVSMVDIARGHEFITGLALQLCTEHNSPQLLLFLRCVMHGLIWFHSMCMAKEQNEICLSITVGFMKLDINRTIGGANLLKIATPSVPAAYVTAAAAAVELGDVLAEALHCPEAL
jgi:hypothetical protein